MKLIRLATPAMSAAILLASISSCSSDRNPFGMTFTTERTNATIKIRLDVEQTRAGEMATTAEKEIKKLTIHVFDERKALETTKNVTVTRGENTVTIDVTQGLKTLYVMSAKSNVNPTVGTNLTTYENSVFDSSLSNIKTDADGFVMVGKSSEQQVMISASEEDLPASNIFDIKLERLVAKSQVKSAGVDGSAFGISFGAAYFRAFQLNERMRVLHNGTDVFDNYVDTDNNGTYNYYSLGVGEYLNAVTSDFTADGCAYMSENIVSNPLSGNTTFLGIRFATTPEKYYSFDTANSTLSVSPENPTAATTYYVVGIQDKVNGIVDYTLDHENKHILTFKNESDAENYMNSLNAGTASAFTVSQTDRPLFAASVSEGTSNAPQFEVIKFDNGYVYYRVNIAHEDASGDSTKKVFKVMRNRFYKVSINSVRSLGFSDESMLRPSDPEAVLDAVGGSWISANISIEDWNVIDQNVDL